MNSAAEPLTGPSHWQRWSIPAAALLGVSLGLFVPQAALWLEPLGILFMQAIRMLILPLIIVSILYGVTHIPQAEGLKRIAARATGLFLALACLASLTGMATALLLKPGSGISLPTTAPETALPTVLAQPSAQGFIDQILPANPFAAMAEGQLLPLTVFCLLVGLALRRAGGEARPLTDGIAAAFAVLQQLTRMVLWFAPIGIFSLLAVLAAKQGLQMVGSLGLLIFGGLLGCLFHGIVTYGLMLRFFAGKSIWRFYRRSQEAMWFAFSSSSSAATLPVSLRVTQEKLGVSRDVATLVLPLGMTINMDGSAIHLALAGAFVAQAAGIDLSWLQWGLIFVSAVVISIGATGVPGVAGLGFILVLTVTGLPMEGLALILAVERIMDMIRTTLNVAGDLAVAVAVEGWERRSGPQE